MTLPTPPRLSGNSTQDLDAVIGWAYKQYSVLVVEQQFEQKLINANAILPLDISISNPPTQFEVTTLKNKINEIITAFKAT